MSDDGNDDAEGIVPCTQLQSTPDSPLQFVYAPLPPEGRNAPREPAQTPSPLSFEETETQPPVPAPPAVSSVPRRHGLRAVIPSSLERPSTNARSVTPIPDPEDDITCIQQTWSRSNAVNGVPSTITEGLRLLRLQRLTTAELGTFLSALKVRRTSKLPKELKMEAMSTLMVNMKICTRNIQDEVNRVQGGVVPLNEEAHRIRNALPQSVSIRTDTTGGKYIVWNSDNTTLTSTPNRSDPSSLQLQQRSAACRQSYFTAGEYARLLHVLADTRMATARQRLMCPRSRQELDCIRTDPWDEYISGLFNDESFRPESVDMLAGGITRSDIDTINPAVLPCPRTASTLKTKFGQLKSLYGTCAARFEASGQGDHDNFVSFAQGRSYIMYTFCFLRVHPILMPLTTRTIPTAAQREEGLPSDADSDGELRTPRSSSKKRRLSGREVTINGLDTLSSAFGGTVQDPEVARKTEEKELEKANADSEKAWADARDAKGRAMLTLLNTISTAKEHRSAAQDEDERAMYDAVIADVRREMSDTFTGRS